MTTRAVVLGAGGEAGVAWEIGLLCGLLEHDVDIREADTLFGTSAGAIVAALLSGTDLQTLYAQQLDPVPTRPAAGAPGETDAATIMAAYRHALAGATTEHDARTRLGTLALQSAPSVEPEWPSRIAQRIGTSRWPSTRLVVIAIDVADGSPHLFDAHSGVSLPDAVAASSAPPMIWPPVRIGDHRYMDGGMRSPTNADLAAGHDTVLVLAPIPATTNPSGPSLDEELARLRQHAAVHLVQAQPGALPEFGPALLD